MVTSDESRYDAIRIDQTIADGRVRYHRFPCIWNWWLGRDHPA